MDPSEELETEEVYKRGGKRRKAPKRKHRAAKRKPTKMGEAVKVGDTVYLIRGNVPTPYSQERRLTSPGQLYGNLPKVLRPQSYGTAPAAYRPMTQHEFLAAGDRMYNRGRNFYDDIMINVNPNNIQPNVKPSKRITPSVNKNALPPIQQPIASSLPFQSEQPAVHLVADKTPSVRAVSSQPSTGFVSTQLGGVHYAVPSAAASEQYETQEEQQAALESIAEARKPRRPRPKVAKFNPFMDEDRPWDDFPGWKYYLDDARKRFPTLNDLKQETPYRSYKEFIESIRDSFTEEDIRPNGKGIDTVGDRVLATLLYSETLKRGGVRRRGRGGY